MSNNVIYIVTGATGYVGNVFAKKLMSQNLNVIGLARSEAKVKRVYKEQTPKIVYGDIRNKEDLKKLFPYEDAKYVVIHTVAYVTIGEGSKEELFDITVKGTQNIIDEALKHNTIKFLQISSSEAIPKGIKLNEDLSNYKPEESKKKGYSKAKSSADEIVFKAIKEHDLNASILMLAGVLGPGDYSHSHMSQVMCDFIEGRLPASINAGYNDFDIRDVADVLLNIIEKSRKNECYIFANKPDKINDILTVIAKKYNKKVPITLPIWVAYFGLPFLTIWSKISRKRPLYTSAALASLRENTDFPISKAVKEFGYNPRPLEETVLDHIEFLQSIGDIKS